MAPELTEESSHTGLKLAVFWTSYVLGTLVMVFSFLLAQVPRSRHGARFTLDHVSWSSAAALLLICVFMGAGMWERPKKADPKGPPVVQYVVTGVACLQLVFSIYGILSFATNR